MKVHAGVKRSSSSSPSPAAEPKARPAFQVPDLSHLARLPNVPPVVVSEQRDPTHLLHEADKASFLSVLRSAIIDAATSELAGTGWTAEQCPYIEHWFAYYGNRGAGEIERALRKYAPAIVAATSLDEYIEPAVTRVRAAIVKWKATAEVDAPEIAIPKIQGQLTELGPGERLPSSVQSRMEHAIGGSLTDVRVHMSSAASRVVQDHDARAITIGSHVAFRTGQFRPGTLAGDALLAHELAHTQQQASAVAPSRDLRGQADEAHADLAAGVGLARLRGIGLGIPAARSTGGLALRRCGSPVPREFDDEHQFEDQKGGELKQTAWLRRFRKDHPDLENVVLDPGPRDDGIMTDNGIRIPQVKGHYLKPRPYYEHRFAAFFAYQGAIHYAELIEAGQYSGATAISEETLSSFGEPLPHDKHLNIENYVKWSYVAKQTADNVQGSLMIAEGVRGLTGAALERPPVARGSVNGATVKNVAAGELEGAATTTPDPKAGPKVVVDPELAPKPPAETKTKPQVDADSTMGEQKPATQEARKYRPCFVAGTLVDLGETSCPIEMITLGSLVLAREEHAPDGSTATARHQVAELHRGHANEVVHVHVAGAKVVCTAFHRFRVRQRGWVDARDLTAHDRLEDLGGAGVEVERVTSEALSTPVATFNLRVPGVSTYFVRVGRHAVLVHNGGPDDFSRTLYWFFGKEPRVRTSGPTIDTDGLSVWRTDNVDDVHKLFDSRVNESGRKVSDPHGYFTQDQLDSAGMAAPKTPGDPKSPLTGKLDHHSVRPATNADPKTALTTPELEQLDAKLKQVKASVVKPSQVTC